MQFDFDSKNPLALVVGIFIFSFLVLGTFSGFVAEPHDDDLISMWNNRGPYKGNTDGWGPNANGELTSPADFKGEYLWVVYTAPWCKAGRSQAQLISKLKKRFPEVTFVNVLSSSETMGVAASENDASKWARKYNLDPELVIALDESIPFVSPTHLLYNRQGLAMFHAEKWMNDDQVDKIIEQFVH